MCVSEFCDLEGLLFIAISLLQMSGSLNHDSGKTKIFAKVKGGQRTQVGVCCGIRKWSYMRNKWYVKTWFI